MKTEAELEEALSRPDPPLVQMMRRLEGDIIILGIAGKMGMSLGRMAVRAAAEAGTQKRVIGVSRFSDPDAQRSLEANGVETVRCDLLDHDAVRALPDAANVIYMVGRKFGTAGSEALTWVVNTLIPAAVARKFAASRIVAFSTGWVYPLLDTPDKGCNEKTPPNPVGEYSQASLGRERVFQYFSEVQQTPTLLLRLNYAIDLRYGVLHDIARWIWEGQPVSLNVPHFNCIWQRDANERALFCLEHCRVPAAALNITGPEVVSVRETAVKLAERLGRPVTFGDNIGQLAYLSDASESVRRFGAPGMSIEEMINRTAMWVKAGGTSLDKPTHFEVSNGTY